MARRPTLLLSLAAVAVLSIAAACGEGGDTGGATPTAGADASPSATADAAGTPPSGFRTELAPIDGLDVLVRESAPPQHALQVESGLPSGCHEFDRYEIDRVGDRITVSVFNRLPADPNLACTAIYGTHTEVIELGSDFTAGVTYTIAVNDRSTTFTAQ